MRAVAGILWIVLVIGCTDQRVPQVTMERDSTVTTLPESRTPPPELDPGEWVFALADSLGGGVEDLIAQLARADSTGWSSEHGRLEARARSALEQLQLRRDQFDPSDLSALGNYCTFVLQKLEALDQFNAAAGLDLRTLREQLEEERSIIEPLIARYSPLF